MGEFAMFEGGDKAIADEVRHEIAIANGEVIDVDSDSDNDEDDTPSISRTDILDMCHWAAGGGLHAIWRSSVFSQFIIITSQFPC